MTDNHINLQYAYGDGKEESCELMKTAVFGTSFMAFRFRDIIL